MCPTALNVVDEIDFSSIPHLEELMEGCEKTEIDVAVCAYRNGSQMQVEGVPRIDSLESDRLLVKSMAPLYVALG